MDSKIDNKEDDHEQDCRWQARAQAEQTLSLMQSHFLSMFVIW